MAKIPQPGSQWMRTIRRLEASYALSGPAALEAMTGIESYILYEEKSMALKAAQKMLADDPSHERWKLRCEHLSMEVKHIEGWLKEHVLPLQSNKTPVQARTKAKDGPDMEMG